VKIASDLAEDVKDLVRGTAVEERKQDLLKLSRMKTEEQLQLRLPRGLRVAEAGFLRRVVGRLDAGRDFFGGVVCFPNILGKLFPLVLIGSAPIPDPRLDRGLERDALGGR